MIDPKSKNKQKKKSLVRKLSSNRNSISPRKRGSCQVKVKNPTHEYFVKQSPYGAYGGTTGLSILT